MGRGDRLDLTLRLLRDQPGITAGELAGRLGTSVRSVFRDVAALRDRGYPVESSRGRGGGLRLHPGFGLGRILLSAEEGLALLLSLAVVEGLGLPMLGRELRPVRTKVVDAFPSSERRRLKGLRERVLVGPGASARVAASWGTADARAMRELQSGFVRSRVIRFDYRKPAGESTRRAEPHAILLNWPAWYLLAHDLERADVRTFRFDRIASVRVEAEEFRPRARAVLHAIGGAEFAEPERWSL